MTSKAMLIEMRGAVTLRRRGHRNAFVAIMAAIVFPTTVIGATVAIRKPEDVGCTGAPAEAAAANQVGWQAHRRRSLDEASAAYDRALALAPSRAATQAEGDLAYRFAPLLLTTRTEPFGLRDMVAVIHPTRPWIAYHLLWDDDIDYPDDNDPSDHEVVWVQLDPERGHILSYYTYFHGRELKAPSEAVAVAQQTGRPSVVVQWGKHGTMPFVWKDLKVIADKGDVEAAFYPLGVPISLEDYNLGIYRKLSTIGRRHQNSPLGQDWPVKFGGSWNDFIDFSTIVDSRKPLHGKPYLEISFFSNAVLNRHFLRYNFRPKIEWPEEMCIKTGAPNKLGS